MGTYEILRVDLTTGISRRETVPDSLVHAYIGGKGLAAHYLANELPEGADPLGPDNLLIFMTGPISGLYPGTCRHVVVTKSPATGGFLDTYAGGWFAWELRKLGLLGIIITGRAGRLSTLRVSDEGTWVEDAGELAGLGIGDVDDHPAFAGYRTCAIGPAGENLVTMASIGNNAGLTKAGRAGYNGRGGAGAVMGAKNLKVVALRGNGRPEATDAVRTLRREIAAQVKAGPAAGPLAEVGTAVGVDMMNAVHVLPTRNFSAGSFEGIEDINHRPVAAYVVDHEACFNCPVRCGTHVRAPEDRGAFPGAESRRLEYETIGLGASNTGNADFSSIVHFSALCDSLGLDTISAGAAIGFAMDCAERGLIESPLRFGDSEGQARLAEDIAHRRGLGTILALGVRAAALAWGVDSSDVPVMEVRGLEYPAYDPRGSVGMALAFATSDRGACHNRSWPISREALSSDPGADPFTPVGKAAMVAADQDDKGPRWSMIFCDFLGYSRADALRMLASVGIHLGEQAWERMGARVWNVVRLLNLREGWTGDGDSAPEALARPLTDSGRSLAPETFATMLREYYEVRGWDAQGRPTAALVSALDLGGYPLGGNSAGETST